MSDYVRKRGEIRFQERFVGLMESPSSWKIVKLVFLRKPDTARKKGIRSYRAIALTSVMSKWYASCLILLLEMEKEPVKWKNLHVGGEDGILASVGYEFAPKTLGMARRKESRGETWCSGKTAKHATKQTCVINVPSALVWKLSIMCFVQNKT